MGTDTIVTLGTGSDNTAVLRWYGQCIYPKKFNGFILFVYLQNTYFVFVLEASTGRWMMGNVCDRTWSRKDWKVFAQGWGGVGDKLDLVGMGMKWFGLGTDGDKKLTSCSFLLQSFFLECVEEETGGGEEEGNWLSRVHCEKDHYKRCAVLLFMQCVNCVLGAAVSFMCTFEHATVWQVAWFERLWCNTLSLLWWLMTGITTLAVIICSILIDDCCEYSKDLSDQSRVSLYVLIAGSLARHSNVVNKSSASASFVGLILSSWSSLHNLESVLSSSDAAYILSTFRLVQNMQWVS